MKTKLYSCTLCLLALTSSAQETTDQAALQAQLSKFASTVTDYSSKIKADPIKDSKVQYAEKIQKECSELERTIANANHVSSYDYRSNSYYSNYTAYTSLVSSNHYPEFTSYYNNMAELSYSKALQNTPDKPEDYVMAENIAYYASLILLAEKQTTLDMLSGKIADLAHAILH